VLELFLITTIVLAGRDGPPGQDKKVLEILVPKITCHGLRKLRRVLARKLSKEAVVALLSQIERIRSLAQIALEMDHMFVVQSTEELSPSYADYPSTLFHTIEVILKNASTMIGTSFEIMSDTTALQDDNANMQKHDLMTWICLSTITCSIRTPSTGIRLALDNASCKTRSFKDTTGRKIRYLRHLFLESVRVDEI
jgi:hypothetical protein